MCLILLAIKSHPKFKFIFLANRDEYYSRETEPAKFWSDYPNLLAGKDLQAGGTWCGITRLGKFSAITNFREPGNKNKLLSRGTLVLDFLTKKSSAEEFYSEYQKDFNKYNGFNLLIGNINEVYYCSNRSQELLKLDRGIHGLSNNLLNVPWYKVKLGKEKLSLLIQKDKINLNNFLELLSDESLADDNELPNTGISKEYEKRLSPIFIRTPIYGTRSSTIILVDESNQVTFVERTLAHTSNQFSTINFNFNIQTE
ncbi:MAG: NRDE family protein [Ignavibacteria bacterium]|nr:NRDE family protein [Ignavibacteria bacterium]